MASKKGIEMSMQTIVIAALALFILIILIVLVSRNSGTINDSLNQCDKRGDNYHCASSCANDESSYGTAGCDPGEVCCVKRDGFLDNN